MWEQDVSNEIELGAEQGAQPGAEQGAQPGAERGAEPGAEPAAEPAAELGADSEVSVGVLDRKGTPPRLHSGEGPAMPAPALAFAAPKAVDSAGAGNSREPSPSQASVWLPPTSGNEPRAARAPPVIIPSTTESSDALPL